MCSAGFQSVELGTNTNERVNVQESVFENPLLRATQSAKAMTNIKIYLNFSYVFFIELHILLTRVQVFQVHCEKK